MEDFPLVCEGIAIGIEDCKVAPQSPSFGGTWEWSIDLGTNFTAEK